MLSLSRIWIAWFVLVCLMSFPWVGFTTDAQWQRVTWVPFLNHRFGSLRTIADVTLNGLLFVPFGFMVSRRRPLLRALPLAAAMALAISVPAEATQLFSTRRFPSATDVAMAIVGAIVGVVTTLPLRLASKPETWTD